MRSGTNTERTGSELGDRDLKAPTGTQVSAEQSASLDDVVGVPSVGKPATSAGAEDERVSSSPVRARAPGGFWPALAMLSVVVPGLAVAASVGLYTSRAKWPGVLNDGGPRSFLVGTGSALICWLLAAALCRSLATPGGGNRAAYGELRQELDDLKAVRSAVDATTEQGRVSIRRADFHIDYLETLLRDPDGSPGRSWVEATGYVELWRRVHRAEEALLVAQTQATLVGAAVNDYLRLEGSNLPKRESLMPRLLSAASVLDPSAAALYLPPPHPNLRNGQVELTDPGNGSADGASTGADASAGAASARNVVLTVRRAINEFRDDRRDGLVRARNHLLATVLVTGAVTYALLGIAFFQGASVRSIVAFSAFYLTGSIVGLFRQLRAASAQDTVAEDDYGLSIARLLHAPLFSGLAAVGGVMLTALLTPVTLSGDTHSAAVPSLSEIFDLTRNQGGLVFAAVFGLTPSLIVTRLQTQAEAYKADLKSSEAAERVVPSSG